MRGCNETWQDLEILRGNVENQQGYLDKEEIYDGGRTREVEEECAHLHTLSRSLPSAPDGCSPAERDEPYALVSFPS